MFAKLGKVNDFSLRDKLIALFLLISIIPAIGLGLLVGVTVEKILGEQATKNTLQLINQVNTTLESSITNVQNVSYLISMDAQIKTFFSSDRKEGNETDQSYSIRQKMQGFTSLYPEIAGILLINKEGKYISNELYAEDRVDLTKEEWYKEAVRNKGIFKIIGKPEKRHIISQINYKDEDVVTVVRAIVDRDTQEITGVLLIDLKLRVIGEAMNNVHIGLSGFLTVIDENGKEIYSTSNSEALEIPETILLEDDWGAYKKVVDGEKMEFIYQRTPFSNWTTVGIFHSDESVAEVKEIQLYLFFFVFFLCFAGITVSYYFSHSISNPIIELMTMMRKIEDGQMEIRYKGKRKDEIGRLGKTFNHMITKINSLITLTEMQEKQKREAELRSLQAHIKPHFLYNTLDTINWMARKHGAKDVAEVVASLSSFFRIGLSKGNDMIPLKDEMKHIQSYLMIQKARYQEKLSYEIIYDSNLTEVTILKLVLQPIVENAIYHGIKERRGPGNINISAIQENACLLLKVTDDGKGMEEEELHALREKLNTLVILKKERKEQINFGYGMMNVQARIKLTYGDAYGLAIDSEHDKGTTVTIKLPMNLEEKKE
ncbi:sensor histidine kinase [Niallia circulans]|jgi:two-component system, sensor histidine kinase YesM|uniref:cache domain-containing sensor histidine kinase n=1 Tax=Niallia TaxID=2837506 RepID=UPI00077C6987|nr:sensor histidine kinase [Niallia circulans]MDR4316169.1 sensor histidine kinase [Niallia circulans]MED4244563.1 sensor histidine kinase [Niallia circulans]NRG31110.1 sensor histidine kinase [Niallia circulans]PAD24985.1 sensor histidine kinase [Niallia circulans]PAD88809.1 sensor histidine kinase [Niallia circulans]